jgi:hypothetical protein
MSKNCKKHFLFFLCLVLVLVSIITMPAEAKGKKGKLTVTYKGKTVTLMTVDNVNDVESSYTSTGCTPPDKLKKSWGKYKKEKSGDSYGYTYKKGKSCLAIQAWDGGNWYSFSIDIKDKNMALCGVKVGMTKKKALSILKKGFGSKAITSGKYSIVVKFGVFPDIVYNLKSGKIKSMSFFHS